MPLKLKKGNRCLVRGLIQRQELNGQVVTLLKWSKEHKRWEVSVENGEYVRIRTENLFVDTDENLLTRKIYTSASSCNIERLNTDPSFEEPSVWGGHSPGVIPFSLDPVFESTFSHMVQGGGELHLRYKSEVERGIGSGQITRVAFESLVAVASKAHICPPGYSNGDTLALAMALNFIGKDNDSVLIFDRLKCRISKNLSPESIFGHDFGHSFPFSSLQQHCSMDTAAELMKVMYNARMGTIAHIESQQGMLISIVEEMKGSKLKSNRGDSGTMIKMVMCGRDDNKSMKCSRLKDELISAAQFGEVDVIGRNGCKTVKVNEYFHCAYVSWLIDDVLETLEQTDARKGSTSKWHRIQNWEKQLTSSIRATTLRLMLDISDEFGFDSWLEGFVSFDLSTFEDMPGVDADRRILRFAFFAELAFNFSLETGAWDARRNRKIKSVTLDSTTDISHSTSSALMSEPSEEQCDHMKKGTKVVLVRADSLNIPVLCNGMEGRVVAVLEKGLYSVSFSNLSVAQTVHSSNLQRPEKVHRETHLCICGNLGDLLCGRCNMKWYCGSKCQSDDYNAHKMGCKALANPDPFGQFLTSSKGLSLNSSPCNSDEEN